LNPLLKLYMFEQWIQDQREHYDLKKNIAILIGSFSNPEAAKKMLNASDSTISTSDEDFEGSWKMVQKPVGRRKRRLTNG
jgi:hypothetical protein